MIALIRNIEGYMHMDKIGLSLDYNNICKDYNTVYLDRDNTDRETMLCMRKVMDWFAPFLTQLLGHFDYGIYRLNTDSKLELGEIVRKRFFFYSLEKEIIAQTFILQKEYTLYDSLANWGENGEESLLIQNDEEGEGVVFYVTKDSDIHRWLLEKMKAFSLDEVPFDQK